MDEPVIGIDLGTTFSCVGVYSWETGRVEIIANEQGNRTTPSIVSYAKSELLVGEGARAKLVTNPENTIYNAKRMIGRQYSDVRQEDLDSWPFTVARTSDDKPRYRVNYMEKEMYVAPEEIGAMVLARMKEIAERHLKRPVTKAVITVPAYFTEPQKRATKDAGMLAGLDVLSLLPEPTASALAYGLDQKAMEGVKKDNLHVDGWYILVFDLGGGTFDVSVLKMDGRGGFIQKAITGDFHLGGEDFDDLIVAHFMEKIGQDYPTLQLTRRSQGRLRAECEKLKRVLSTTMDATLEVELQGFELCYEMSRGEFESICGELFECVIGEVKAALELARLQPRDIDDIVLVGGSTRIPAVQSMLKSLFSGKNLWFGINPDEAVAVGATQYAAALVRSRNKSVVPVAPPTKPAVPTGAVGFQLDNLVLTNVTPLTLGIELWNGDMDVLIPRGTQIPAEKTDYYTTGVDNQPTVVIKIVEGEKHRARENSLLGKFSLQMPPAPCGVPKIEVKFEITLEGLFLVSAKDLSSGKRTTIQIDRVNLSAQEKEKMMLNRNQSAAQQSGALAMRESRNDFFTHVYGIQSTVSHAPILEVEKSVIMHACSEALQWAESHPSAPKYELRHQKHLLDVKWDPVRDAIAGWRQQPGGAAIGIAPHRLVQSSFVPPPPPQFRQMGNSQNQQPQQPAQLLVGRPAPQLQPQPQPAPVGILRKQVPPQNNQNQQPSLQQQCAQQYGGPPQQQQQRVPGGYAVPPPQQKQQQGGGGGFVIPQNTNQNRVGGGGYPMPQQQNGMAPQQQQQQGGGGGMNPQPNRMR